MRKFLFYSIPVNLLFIFFSVSLNATTHTTVASGYWTNNNIWQNGVAPSLITSDTIIIRNFVEFSSNIELIAPAYLFVDSTGALCGHDTIISNSGTGITTYGILEADVLLVPGGDIFFYPPGYIILSEYAHLSNGASLHSTTNTAVGPWFACITKSDAVIEIQNSAFVLYPNPFDELVNISSKLSFDEFIISDMSGRVVLRGVPQMNSIDLSSLREGFYYLILKNGEGVLERKLFKRRLN